MHGSVSDPIYVTKILAQNHTQRCHSPQNDFECANIITSTGLTLLGLERFDTWDNISLQGVDLNFLLVMRNVLFIEPQTLSVNLFPKKC